MTSDDVPTTSGIYRITCTVTGKFYIGSAKSLRRRYRDHFSYLRRNAHMNSKLQRAWNKHGGDTFHFEVLEFVLLPELLIPREQYWIDKLQAVEKGFNLSPTADSRLGWKPSLETREKMRLAHLGQVGHNRGKKASPKVCAILRSARLGKPGPNRGKKFSPETCAKISASKRGKPNPHEGHKQTPETREKIRQAGIGRTYTPETIEKVRAAKIGNTNGAKDYIVTSPEGIEYEVHNLKAFCKEHHLTPQALSLVASGKRDQHKGWKARYLNIA